MLYANIAISKQNGGMNVSDIIEKERFYELDSQDMDFVCGGSTIVDKVDANLLKVSPSHKCNCGQFKKGDACGNIDICDNCVHSQTPYLGADIIYCSKQRA